MEVVATIGTAELPPRSPKLSPRNAKRREPLMIKDGEISQVSHFSVPAVYEPYLDGILITRGTLSDRIEKLASDILVDYEGITIHFLCVLKGCVMISAGAFRIAHGDCA
jgi:hypothetical protein